MIRTRRRLLEAAAAWPAFHVLGAHKAFWEEKAPADWTAEEKRMILEQSPWAREGAARFEVEKKAPTVPYQGVAKPGGDVPGAIPGERPGGVPTVPIGEAPPPVPKADTGRPVQFTVRARWESARPVRLAGGPELPESTEGFYVIRLRGMPLMPAARTGEGADAPNPNQAMLEAIRQTARLERKDKPAIRCAHLLTGSGAAAAELLLFFPRGAKPITVAEKIVTLESRFGPFHLSVKFPLKDMVYKGALSL